MEELYIGLMSGTSADGINAALVNFNQSQPKLIGSHYHAFPPEVRQKILSLCHPGADEINRLGELDVFLGKAFANAVQTLLNNEKVDPKQIRAIGSHGQTIRHHPHRQFTLQIGDPNIIAAETKITTVADFRRRDIAHGGQGAPLVPAFHQHILATEKNNRVVVNIGGIANLTLLATTQPLIGFDSGPGNILLDYWIGKNLQQSYDKNGMWAAQGTVDKKLLANLLNDPYFKIEPPKSTGHEYFNATWLNQYLNKDLSPVDVQTTLVELTATSIIDAIKKYLSHGEILICGGGVHNTFLMQRLSALAKPLTVYSTDDFGVDPDWVEAIAFAWLAKQTIEKKPSNVTSVTGARQPTILGGIYHATVLAEVDT